MCEPADAMLFMQAYFDSQRIVRENECEMDVNKAIEANDDQRRNKTNDFSRN